MKKYKYSASDESLMTPFLYRFFISPMLKIVPYQIPANFITLFSNSCVLLSFIIATMGYYNNNFNLYFLIPILCFAYIVGDSFDGVQARRTDTGSSLGEYFDHFLDSFVTGLLTGTLLFAMRSKVGLILIFPYQALYLGQIGAFWERLKTGVISFAKISTSEGVMTIAISSFLVSFPFMKPLLEPRLIIGLSYLDCFLLICFFFAGVAGIKAFFVAKTFSVRLCLHVVLSSIVNVLCVYFSFNILQITIIITLYNAFFISPLLSSVSTGKKEGWPDIIIPISFVALYYLPQYTFIIYIMQLSYLALRIIIRFAIFFHTNRHSWVWCNKNCHDVDLFAKKGRH